jgi:hypothetical protein
VHDALAWNVVQLLTVLPMKQSSFAVTVVEPASAAEWSAAIGTRTLFVESLVPTDELGVPVYHVDIGKLTAAQRTRLVHHLSLKFHLAEAQVNQKLDRQGLPILAAYCSPLRRTQRPVR